MKKRLLTAWIIACMFICLVGQTPITALAEGDDTRVISVPEGLQDVLINETPETQTAETEIIKEESTDVQTQQNDENNDVQSVQGEATGETDAQNLTVGEDETSATQNEVIDETNEASTEQNETAGDTNETLNPQSEDKVDTNENQSEQTGEVVTGIDETPAAQNETATETPTQNQPAQGENVIAETVECVEQSVEALLPEGTHNHGDIVRVSGLLPKEAIVEAIPVDVEIEGQIVLLAYDITIYENEEKKNAGICWQPEEGGLNVEFISSALEESEEEVNIWHMEDSEQDPEYVTAAPSSDDSVEFTAESFSVYVVTETKLTATIIASDGNTYEINVTYDNKSGIPMDGTALKVDELKPGDDGYDEYIEESASKVGAKAEELEFSKVFDIKIVDENDENTVYEPTGNVDVSIRVIGVSLSEYPQVNVLHFVEQRNAESRLVYDVESTINEDKVEFTTDSFSVYVVLSAPEPPPTPVIQKVKDLNELAGNYSNAAGFFLSYGSNIYFTNSLNDKSAFVESTSINDASHWFLEAVPGQSNRYYIYTKISGVTKYMYNTSGNLMGLSETNKTAFEFDCPSGTTEMFTLKVVGANKWLQHSGSGNGIRLYTDINNPTNSQISLTYASSASIQDDYYNLDGKTFSIAYYEDGVKGAGLSSQSLNNNSNRLAAVELLVRPDVLNSSGELLISQDSDLTEWTFEWIEGTKYYITTQIGGTKYYLTLAKDKASLTTSPTDNAKISVESGTGENIYKYRFSSSGFSLTLSGGKSTGGFTGSNNGDQYSYLNLVSKSALLEDDDFTVYSAEKVDLSDRTMVPDGAKVVLYVRKWNDTTKKYEIYAVNYDGSLVRAYESGGLIQWVGSTINTMVWEFTEYLDDNGDPNYYYQLKNTYPGGTASNCIRPSVDGTFLRTESAFPNSFDRSINLNGRRYGYYYSSILAWDDPSYAYIGLRVKDDCSGLEICPMGAADSFYFAIMTDIDPTVLETTTVETIDHEQYGIKMRMVDFSSSNTGTNNAMTTFFLGKTSLNGNDLTKELPGLLSTDFGADGYPTNNNGQSMKDLFENKGQGLYDVNHLFIKNTYYSSGYYEFDSTQNFASFYDENGNKDNHNFTVYNELGTNDNKNSDSMKHGQFLPYNSLSNNYAVTNPYNLFTATLQELPDSDPRKWEKLRLVEGTTDYHFAVEIEAPFTQTPSGLDAWGHDIIYEFTGDDDFWLYVDGELVIDLGGVHSALPGSVNYKTGEVKVNGKTKTLRQVFEENYRGRKGYSARANATSEQNADVDAYLSQYFEDGQVIFKDYSEHTMRIFFMERGAGASNLHMRFNLASVRPGTVLLSKEIEGVDNTESYMSEYPFQIYYRETSSGEGELLNVGIAGISVLYKDTNRTVTFYPSYTAPDGKVYQNVFILLPGEEAEIEFPSNAMEYYVKECALDITEMDNSTNPPTTIHQGVYTHVEANGELLTGVPNGMGADRQDFATGWEEVKKRGRLKFTNHVDPNAKGTLTFVKHLYDESGNHRIYNADNDTTFTFRLYLGTENTPDDALPLADMYSYHVKDENGNYCRWNSTAGKLEAIGSGKNDYTALSDAEKSQVTFTTSMYGSIGNVPVDYTVEIREIPAGTKYKVEERENELPDGYTLQKYVTTLDGVTYNESKNPASGVINVVADLNRIEIRNIKGWGLRCYKEWSDSKWMESRDPIYMAVYIDDNGTLTFVDNSVRRIERNQDSAYWFFDTIQDLDGSGICDASDFEKYVVREVTITNSSPTVDNMSRVTDYGTATPLAVDGTGTVTLNGKQNGDSSDSSYIYTVTEYIQGSLTQYSNVRKDKIINKRAGLDLYVTKWDGTTKLQGAVFNLKDGNNVSVGNFTSDDNGLITTAYLRDNEIYTLTETSSPAGFIGLQQPLLLKRDGSQVYVSNDNGSTWESTVANSSDGWYFADDTDVTSGTDIRIGVLTVKNKPYTLQVKKTQQTTNGAPLQGVTFALYRQVTGNDGNPRKDYQPIPGYASLETDADGFVPEITDDFEDGTLQAGTYYLHETYPLPGYQPLSEDIVFRISDIGFVDLISNPDGVILTQDNVIIVPNQVEGTIELTIKKQVVNGTTADTNGTNKFNYSVKLYLPDGQTPWNYADGSTFNNGSASFSLGHDETKVLTIPLGAVAKVTETPNNYYTTTADMAVTTSGETTTSLFEFNSSSLMSTVTVKDATNLTLTYSNTRKTVTVTVNKKVEGGGGNFDFTANLKDGTTLCKGWTLNNNGTSGDTTDDVVTGNNGNASFTLSPATNKTVKIVLTVPYGATISVTEATYSNYKTKVGNSETSTWTGNKLTSNQNVTFTNTEINVAPTNYVTNYNPFFMMFGFGAILIGLIVPTVVMIKRRKEEEE